MKNTENEQLYIEGWERKIHSCAFSGHRNTQEDFDREKLRQEIVSLIEKGAETFYCGMAVGFDLAAGETVIQLKKEYPKIRLCACIPCRNQQKNYSLCDALRYERLLSECAEKEVLSEEYYRGCMLVRNEYMAKRADALVCYCRRDTGGTAYTVRLFQKYGKPVFFI